MRISFCVGSVFFLRSYISKCTLQKDIYEIQRWEQWDCGYASLIRCLCMFHIIDIIGYNMIKYDKVVLKCFGRNANESYVRIYKKSRNNNAIIGI